MGAAPAALADASVISTMSAWIEQALRPISDADPAVLSKYVLAVLKKDTPLDTMRANCVKELEDFLEDKTRGFVSKRAAASRSSSSLLRGDAPLRAWFPRSRSENASLSVRTS